MLFIPGSTEKRISPETADQSFTGHAEIATWCGLPNPNPSTRKWIGDTGRDFYIRLCSYCGVKLKHRSHPMASQSGRTVTLKGPSRGWWLTLGTAHQVAISAWPVKPGQQSLEKFSEFCVCVCVCVSRRQCSPYVLQARQQRQKNK